MAAGVCRAWLGARAYIQVIDNAFFKRQGERCALLRTLELPANRGRILDRNGN
jgi:cell division protein FtsI (penicillin-binding protein 3)